MRTLLVLTMLLVACGESASPEPTRAPPSSIAPPSSSEARDEAMRAARLEALEVAAHPNGVVTMSFGTPIIAGALPEAALQSVFDERGHEIAYCFQHAVDEAGGAPELTVVFTVRSDGSVVRPPTFDPADVAGTWVADCVAQTIGAWTFAALTEGESHVRYPIRYTVPALPPG